MARCPSRRLIAGVLVAGALAGGPAHADPPAQPAAADREAEAEARFRDGSAAFDAGRVDEACTAFGDSLKLYATLSTLLNLALCYEKQGKTASAWLGFSHAAAWANDAALRDRREFANDHMLRLERSLSRVEIHVPDGTPVALSIDREPASDARRSWPVFLDPGEHLIEASAPAHVSFVTRVSVPAAPAAAIIVEIPPLLAEVIAAPAAPPPAGKTPSSLPARRVAGWVLGGVGLAVVGLGGYFGIDAVSKTSALSGSCPEGCNGSQARASEVASLVAFGAGLSGLATGAWLAFGARDPAPRIAHIVVVPRVGAQGGELGLAGTW